MSNSLQNDGTPANSDRRHWLIYSLFFLSGFAALVYEASWSRLVGLALGNTADAAALVLAAMFAGLAAGQFLGGGLAVRVSPLLGYGMAEVAAAGWACFVPLALAWVGSPADEKSAAWFRDAFFGQAAWCFLILFPATLPLGATLPFVAAVLSTPGGARRHVGLAYGLNTAGGFFGIVVGTVLLLVTVGVGASGLLAAALSAGCGLIACVVALSRRGIGVQPITAKAESEPAGSSPAWLAVAAISGFGTLALEVLFTRMFALVFHNSAFTFAAIVAGFLLALSLGAAIASRLGKRIAPARIATVAFALGGLVLSVSVAVFARLTALNYFTWGDTFASYLLGAFSLVLLLVLPPITLLGMALPAALQAANGAKAVGFLTALNTLAAAVGALAAGMLLPPLLGLWPSFAGFVVFFTLSGAVFLALERFKKLAAAFTIAGAVALVMNGPTDPHSAEVELLRRWESAYGWIDVVRNRKDGSLAVRQNLHYRHGSTKMAMHQYRQSRLPLLLHSTPKDVAFLGLGTGVTAASVVADRDIERAVIIELIPEVVEASRLLAATNLGVIDHPKVEVRVDDARHELARNPRQFDVIVSDLFVPWENRAGYLYTVEFYQTVQCRLRPEGLFCQWLALYQVGPEQFELIADSFASVFPHTTIWWGQLDSHYPIVALIGRETPLRLDAKHLKQRFATQVLPGGADPDLRIPSDVPALYLGDWRLDPSRKRNTDEHPWLEFTAPGSQRSGRMLNGRGLQSYFDRVFVRLPAESVQFDREVDALMPNAEHRALQRLSLFADVIPEK